MGDHRVGCKRLYNVLGCKLPCHSLGMSFPVSNGTWIDLYIGPRPRMGIRVGKSGMYVLPDRKSFFGSWDSFQDASDEGSPGNLFLEIFCAMVVTVPDHVSAAFRHDEEGAKQTLLDMVVERVETFRTTIDAVAGTIGLRLNNQFVLELLNEDRLVYRDVFGAEIAMHQFQSPGLRVLDHIAITDYGIQELTWLLPRYGQAKAETAEAYGSILNWLLRAWSEHDRVYRFFALFTPLEMALQGVTVEAKAESKQMRRSTRNLIKRYGGETKDELLAYFDSSMGRLRPSLEERFAESARDAALAGWEQDITEFGRLNKIRNGLIHRGDTKLRLPESTHLPSLDEVAALQRLVERYVSFTLFGVDAVVPGRMEDTL
jgi:hypothetical protein